MLIVEDGTIVPGANTLVDVATVRAYAADRGLTLPVDDAEVEQKIHLAMDWFIGHEFKGTRVDAAQTLPFPRAGVVIDGIAYDSDVIPPLAIACVNQATCDAATFELQPSYAGDASGAIKKKKLDVMEKEFFEPSFTSRMPSTPKLNALLAPLVSGGLGSGRLNVVRV